MACIIVGILFRFWKFNDKEVVTTKNISSNKNSNVTFSNLGEVLASSITNAINTVVMIGGFVILFSVVISILNNSGLLHLLSNIFYPVFKLLNIDTNYIHSVLSGFIELTNGLSILTNINTKSISVPIILSSFLLGFGGISILLQVLSITSKSDISIKPYIIGKLLHGIIAAILTYLFIHIFPIFNLDIVPIFSQNVNKTAIYSYSNPFILFILGLILLLTAFLLCFKKKEQKRTSLVLVISIKL